MYMYDEIALMLWGHEEAISAFVHNTRFPEYLVQVYIIFFISNQHQMECHQIRSDSKVRDRLQYLEET